MEYILSFQIKSRSIVNKDKFYFKSKETLQDYLKGILEEYFKVNFMYYKRRLDISKIPSYINDMLEKVMEQPIYIPYRKFTIVSRCKQSQLDNVKIKNINSDTLFLKDFSQYRPTADKKYHYIVLSVEEVKESTYKDIYDSLKWFMNIKYNQRDYDCDTLEKIKNNLINS